MSMRYLSPVFPQASTGAVAHYVRSQHCRYVALAMPIALLCLLKLLQVVPLTAYHGAAWGLF